jgi:hypothetical protein
MAVVGSAGQTSRAFGPEFLVSGHAVEGSFLRFEFSATTPFSSWQDTLRVEVGPGRDRTPPRVPPLATRPNPYGVDFALPVAHVLDGSHIVEAAVAIMTD